MKITKIEWLFIVIIILIFLIVFAALDKNSVLVQFLVAWLIIKISIIFIFYKILISPEVGNKKLRSINPNDPNIGEKILVMKAVHYSAFKLFADIKSTIVILESTRELEKLYFRAKMRNMKIKHEVLLDG